MKAEGDDVVGWSNVYVPAARKLRGDDGMWMAPMSTTVDELETLFAGVEPLPASELGLPMPPDPKPAAAPSTAAAGCPRRCGRSRCSARPGCWRGP